jgi:mono/diheme cytochrome c family protein
MAKKQDVLMNHDYDGIKEFDNDLPPWWLWLFYIAIGFSIVYWLYYHVFFIGDLQIAEYNKEMNPNWQPPAQYASGVLPEYRSPFYAPKKDVTPYTESLFSAYIGAEVPSDALIIEAMRRADADQLDILKTSFPDLFKRMNEAPSVQPAGAAANKALNFTALTDEESLGEGKEIFDKNCASCHAVDGGGLVGPNLTDDYWIHGAGINNVSKVISNGVPAKGMITWRGILSPEQIEKVASYILTFHGTSPAKPKQPEGEKVEYPL